MERENPPPVGISLYIELPSSPLQSLDLVRQLSLSTSQKHLHLDQLYCDSFLVINLVLENYTIFKESPVRFKEPTCARFFYYLQIEPFCYHTSLGSPA